MPTDWSSRLQSRMPALRHVVDQHRDKRPLHNKVLLLIQHQMEDELAQVKSMFELGVRLVDIHWIDIPYTSRPCVREELVRVGVEKRNFWNNDFVPLAHYESYQIPRVRRWIEERWENVCGGRDLIVLDDGGYFLRAVANDPPDRPAAVVEQTMRGIKVVRDDPNVMHCVQTKIPLINVGESEAKKSIESPVIAGSVLLGLENDFAQCNANPWRSEWLIVGWGSVGSEVGRLLRDRIPSRRLWVRDLDPGRLECARRAGHSIPGSTSGHRFGVVIGATGDRTLNAGMLESVEDGGFLASVSSASVEFCRDELLAGRLCYRLANESEITDLHSHMLFASAPGKKFWLFNGGFPVNFDRGVVDRIPPERIQFTAALMIEGAVQATRSREAGIHEINRDFQNYLLKCARTR